MTGKKENTASMHRFVGPLLVAAGALVLWLIHAGSPLLVLPIIATATIASAAARSAWMRPYSDLLSWGAVVALLFIWSSTSLILVDLQTLGLTIVGATLLIMGIHVPPQRSADPGPTMGFVGWTAVITLVALTIWWPSLGFSAGNLFVWDPFTPVGAALRIAGLLAILATTAGAAILFILLANTRKEHDAKRRDATSGSTLTGKQRSREMARKGIQ